MQQFIVYELVPTLQRNWSYLSSLLLRNMFDVFFPGTSYDALGIPMELIDLHFLALLTKVISV